MACNCCAMHKTKANRLKYATLSLRCKVCYGLALFTYVCVRSFAFAFALCLSPTYRICHWLRLRHRLSRCLDFSQRHSRRRLYLCLQIKFQLSISIHYKSALALKPHFKPRQRKLRIRSAKQNRRRQVEAKPVIYMYVCLCVCIYSHPHTYIPTHTRKYLKAAAKLIVIDTYWTADADWVSLCVPCTVYTERTFALSAWDATMCQSRNPSVQKNQ